jgi:hypothetical protein
MCKQQAASAEGLTDKESACSTLLSGYKGDGLCSGGGSSPGPSGASNLDGGNTQIGTGGPDAGGEPAVCAKYLDCVAASTPSLAATSIAQYGPTGTCWGHGAELASTCVTACRTGLADLQESDPVSCPHCTSAADCFGATPACWGGQCVECASDGDCKSSTAPYCSAQTHTCTGCTANAQCASHLCESGACCVAHACDATQFNCGAVDDGCGGKAGCQYSICPLGACVSNVCSTAGTPCTVGATGTCGSGEKCMYDAWHQAYLCSPTAPDHTKCTDTGGSDTCNFGYESISDHTPIDSYFCDIGGDGVHGVCIQYCLATNECPTGQTCKPQPGQVTISPTAIGQCL